MKQSFIKSSSGDMPGLLPADDEAKEQLAKIPDGTELVLDIKRSRNAKFHRYAFAMFSRLHEMIDIDIAFDPWRHWLLIQAGYCTTTGFPDGSILVEAESMSFESMSQDKFEKVWKDLHRKFCEIYGQKITYDQLTEVSVM